MISGVRTSPKGREVLVAYLRSESHPIKIAQRDIVFLSACYKRTFTDWATINQYMDLKPEDLNKVVTKLEKLQLVECERPAVAERPGHRTRFGFDKNGQHVWL